MKDGIHFTQRWLKGLAIALLLGAPLASADLITFDDLDPSEGSVSEQSYAGFNWDSRWGLGDSGMSGFGDAAHSGSQFLFNQGFESNLEITRDNPFDFMGAYFASTSNYNNMSFWITLVAYDGQGNKVGELVDAQINPDFENQPLWIAADFTNVSRLVVDAAGGIFAMDSLQFQDTAVSVNEAGGFVLLLIGLGGLWAARRRVH
ncbi:MULTISPECIES: hypothetical protein [Marinimicrobium]|jgi:hypothetical protein|uniref:Secreted protein with PEP-CTERM sorting signal n=1 Tax=Marinimicrobium koreense TaxID=306545 RepID=A0A3N1P1U0_9GAMM|nr:MULTISPECIES: hypothetical protein [Marinimicrobium]MAN51594.1 hypothetical protein [Marinimicrobium sp.]ROQ20680.1 hypothetical protein EDC38_1293 [Marinimicrobium koreense]UZJ45947.1 hypothetical protein OOT55_07835 [Marinimicrobium sp. C6131]